MRLWEYVVRLNGHELKKKSDPLPLREAITCYIKEQREDFSKSTLGTWAGIRDKHLQSIMDCDIYGLTEHQIQKAIDDELETGLSVNTVKKYKSLVLKVLDAYRPDYKPVIVVKKLN